MWKSCESSNVILFCVPNFFVRYETHASTENQNKAISRYLAAGRGSEAGHITIVLRLNSERISLKSEFNYVHRFYRVVLHKDQVLLKKIFQVECAKMKFITFGPPF